MNERREKNAISVIVPVKDGERTIHACLESLASQGMRPDEIIVVDNGSGDGTVTRVKEWAFAHPDLQVQLAFEIKAGPSAARNRGAKGAKGRILAFLDADCIAPPDWLKSLSTPMQEGSVAVGGPYREDPSLPAIEKYAARSWFFGKQNPAISFPNPFISRFLLGGNLALLRRHWEKIGGFDETLTTGEDLDLCFRLRREGVPMRLVFSAAVVHQTASSASKRIRRAFRHGILQSRLTERDFPRRLTLSLFEKSWQLPFPCAVAIEGASLTKCLGLLIVLGYFHALWAWFFLFALVLGWEMRMLFRMIRLGMPVHLKECLGIPLGWMVARFSMEIGRLVGSVRYRVLCW